MILLQIFFTFILIGLTTFGGGYSVIPLVDDLVVKKYGWLTEKAVADIVSISEMSPGPFSLNCATFVGTKIAGIPGALIATTGFLLPSFIIITILAYCYNRFHKIPAVKHIFSVLNACIIGVLFASAVNLFNSSVFIGKVIGGKIDVIALVIFLLSFIVIFRFKYNPVIIIFVSAILGMVVYPLIK